MIVLKVDLEGIAVREFERGIDGHSIFLSESTEDKLMYIGTT